MKIIKSNCENNGMLPLFKRSAVMLIMAGAICLVGCKKPAPVSNPTDTTKEPSPTVAVETPEKTNTGSEINMAKGFTRETGEGKIQLTDEAQYLDKMKSIEGTAYTIGMSYDKMTDGSNRIDEKSLVLTIKDKEHTYTVSSGSFAFYNIEKKADPELAYLADVNGTLVTFRYNEICDESGNTTATNGRFDMLLTYGSSRVADEISWYDEKLGKNDLLFDCLKLELSKPYSIEAK